MNHKIASAAALTVAALLASAGPGAAAISETTLSGASVSGESISNARIEGSTVSQASIRNSGVEDSVLSRVSIRDASVVDSYVHRASIESASVRDSRVENARLSDVTLHDVTVCSARAAGEGVGDCRLVSTDGDGLSTHAMLTEDAPETVAPGESFDVTVSDVDADELTVTNDPAGATALGFDATASNETIAGLEVWVDGERMGNLSLGESFDLDGADDFTLRVNVAESGIIDGSTLGLVLELDGHGLRTAMTTLDVVATSLGFAPLDQQAFAPFLADNVARLVISVATDENGNVDRDLDIAYEVDVLEVATGHDEGNGPNVGEDIHDHSYLHGDSEFFSDNPIGYVNPESEAAHHPATLEFILRDMVGVEGITYGAANFYATHLVAQSPYYTKVMLHADTTNADGEHLEAEPIEIEMSRLPDEERSASTPFGPMGDPMFPGEGTLRVEFVDEDGNPVDRKAGWRLVIQETPESHRVTMNVLYDEDGGSVDEQPLASTEPVGLPFGDFVPHEYLVCLHHDGGESCANDGELVSIEAGETTTVQIVVS